MSNRLQRIPNWLACRPIAHRGLHNKGVPENTLAAFENAICHNYPIELDVQILEDDSVVVFHDTNLIRLTGTHANVEEQLLSNVDALRVGGSDQKIPTLSEVLSLVRGRVPVLVEVKKELRADYRLEMDLLKQLSSYQGEAAVQSFNSISMAFIKNMAPHLTVGYLSFTHDNNRNDYNAWETLRNQFHNYISKPDFLAYNIADLPSDFATELHNAGLPLIAWTVQNREQEQKALSQCNNYIFEGIRP